MWKKEFFELYFSEKSNKNKFKEAYEFKDKNFPKSLYKYKKPNSYSLDLLRNDLIYLSHPQDFNDPYEGDILFESKKLHEDFEKRLIDLTLCNPNFKCSDEEYDKISNSDDPYLEFLKIIRENDHMVNKSIPLKEFQKKMLWITQNILDKTFSDFNNTKKMMTLLVCFSERKTINPMWAHYAQNHEGFCVEYNLKEDSNKVFLSNCCYPIDYVKHNDYTDELIQIRNKTTKNVLKLIREPFLKKSIDWNYEKEWRILATTDPSLWNIIKKINSGYFIKMPKPRAVFIGLNIENDYKNKIKKICKNREISLFEMIKDKSRYNLQSKSMFSFVSGNLDDVNHITKCIENGILKNLLYHHFFDKLTLGSSMESADLILKSFENLSYNKLTSFLDTILFKKEYTPVLSDYYSNVLIFLIKMYKLDKYNNLKTSDGMNIKENLISWIHMSLFDFHKKPVIRYLKAFEKLLRRFYCRYAILENEDRKFFENKLSNFYEITADSISCIYPPCNPDLKGINNDFYEEYGEFTPYKNSESYIHPFSDIDLIEVINGYILSNLNLILNEFYNNNYFIADECYIEFKKFKNIVEELENFTEKEFINVKKNSEKYWRLDLSSMTEPNFDFSMSTICHTLNYYNEILLLLNKEDKERLKTIAKIRIKDEKFPKGTYISTYVEKCCDKLGLSNKEKFISLEKLDEYFNPCKNPYTFEI